jgi:hypothetical protein
MLSNIWWKATHSVDFEGKRDWKEPKMSGDIGEIMMIFAGPRKEWCECVSSYGIN